MTSSQTRIPIISFQDPGHDDTMATFLALGTPNVDLLAVATSAGNQTLDKTTINALNTLNVLGRNDIPVVMGSAHALLSPLTICPEIHGESGLETTDKNFVWPPLENHAVGDVHAIEYVAKLLLSRPDDAPKVHIVATGMLTDVALLLAVYPQCIRHIAQLSVMGGSFREAGNTGRAAEFNIQIDAVAAQMVFNHGCNEEELLILQTTQTTPGNTTLKKFPIVLIPLDVTHTALVTHDVINRIKTDVVDKEGNPSKFALLCLGLLQFFTDTYRDLFDFHIGPPLHDPLALFYPLAYQHNISNQCVLPLKPGGDVIDQKLFTTRHVRLDVETAPNSLAHGATVVDYHNLEKSSKNIILATKVNVDAFFDYLITALKRGSDMCIL